MSAKINSCDCERAGVLLRSITVTMCRYAAAQLHHTAELSLLFWEGLGGKRRWGLGSIYERGHTYKGGGGGSVSEHIGIGSFAFSEFAQQVMPLPRWPTVPPSPPDPEARTAHVC